MLLRELSGQNPFLSSSIEHDDESAFNHRLLPVETYQELVAEVCKNSAESASKFIEQYNTFINDNITIIPCHTLKKGEYQINLKAIDIESSRKRIIVFIDKYTNAEIARFERSKEKIEFRAYGDTIHLQIEGNLENSCFIFNNEDASIYLNANFSAKKMFIGANVKQLIYSGTTSIADSLSIDSSGTWLLTKSSNVNADRAYLRLDGLDIAGKLIVSDTVTLQIDNAVSMGPAGILSAKSVVNINANAMSRIRGKILTTGSVVAKIKDSIYIDGSGEIDAKINIQLSAKNLMCTDKSILRAANDLVCAISKTAIFDKSTTLLAHNFLIKAPIIKNYSPNLSLDNADFNIQDTMTNHPTGIIKTKMGLKIRGESFWTGGKIEYGKSLNVTLNKVFVLGMAESKDIYEYFKNISDKPSRPCISGGDAVVVAGLFLNLFSGMWTKNLSITALAEIDLLGVTCSTNTVKSRILAVDAGVSLPNIPAIIDNLSEFFNLLATHQYSTALESIISKSVFFKASSYARFVTRTLFPALGKPIDFAWGALSLAAALPGLCIQIQNLYNQKSKGIDIEPFQYYTLITALNSAATQAVTLESQTSLFSDGIGSVEFHAPASLDALGMDILAMALPYTNTTSLISFNMAIQANASVQQRDFMSFSRYNFLMAMNASKTVYSASDQNDYTFANNYSITGNQAAISGVVYANNFFVNLNDFILSANVIASQAFIQTQHLNLSQDSKSNIEKITVITDDASLNGSIKSDETYLQATHLTSTKDSNTQVDKLDIVSEEAKLDGSTVSDEAYLQVNHLTFADNSHTQVNELEVVSQEASLGGSIQTVHAAISATTTLTNSGSIEAINEKSGPNDEKAPPVIEEQAQNIMVSAGSKLTANGQTIALIAMDELAVRGDIKTDLLVEEAKDILHDGNETVHKELVSASERIDNNGSVHLTKSGDELGEVDFIAPALNSSPASRVDGDGNLFIEAKQESLGSVDVNRISIVTDDIKDEKDFILERGIWANVQYRDGLSLTSKNDIDFDEAMNLNKDLAISANTIRVDSNISSGKSLDLTTTGGGVYISNVSVTADQILSINSNNDFINNKGYLYGGEFYIHSKNDAVNNAGVWASANYLEVKSDNGSIMNLCDEYNVQGQYDVMKHYDPGYLLGGAGANHDGVGLVLSAGNKIIIDGSVVSSVGSNVLSGDNGIDITARHHTYESYYRHSKTWYGKESTTREYTNQVQASTIYSANGSNTFTSKSGYIYSCAGQILSNHDNNFYAQGNITLLGMQLENKLYKDKSSWWGLSDHQATQIDDENVPTFVINPENTRFISSQQNVNIYNAYIQNAGTLEIDGLNVTISDPVLNHYYSDESRGFSISSPLLSIPNNLTTLYNDFNSLMNSKNSLEYGANTWNMGVDALNSLNGVIGGLRNASLTQTLFPASYLTSVDLTYSHTKTTVTSQTLANNVGLNVGNLKINASDTLTFEGVPIAVAGYAIINARRFDQTGVATHSTMKTDSQSASIGLSLQGSPNFGASVSESGSSSTYYYNQSFNVGGKLTVNADLWNLSDANVVAGTLDANVGDLSIISHTNTSSSYSLAASANTNGNFSVSESSNHSAMIGTPSSIVTLHGINLTANNIYLEGAKIINQGGPSDIKANTITSKSVDEYNHGQSFGFSGNINNFTNPTPGVDWKQSIPTFSVAVGYQNYTAEQLATINGANINAGNFQGDKLNTADADGLKVYQNDHLNLQLKVPVFSDAGIEQLKSNLNWAADKVFGDSIPDYLLEPNTNTQAATLIKPNDSGNDKDSDDDLPPLIDEENDHQIHAQHNNTSDTESSTEETNHDAKNDNTSNQDSTDKKEKYSSSTYFSSSSKQDKWRNTMFSASNDSTGLNTSLSLNNSAMNVPDDNQSSQSSPTNSAPAAKTNPIAEESTALPRSFTADLPEVYPAFEINDEPDPSTVDLNLDIAPVHNTQYIPKQNANSADQPDDYLSETKKDDLLKEQIFAPTNSALQTAQIGSGLYEGIQDHVVYAYINPENWSKESMKKIGDMTNDISVEYKEIAVERADNASKILAMPVTDDIAAETGFDLGRNMSNAESGIAAEFETGSKVLSDFSIFAKRGIVVLDIADTASDVINAKPEERARTAFVKGAEVPGEYIGAYLGDIALIAVVPETGGASLLLTPAVTVGTAAAVGYASEKIAEKLADGYNLISTYMRR